MTGKVPSISIITATYNAAEHLPSLIESIRQQTDKDFEWIVIDGASQDGTVKIIEDARDVITDYISETDCGIYDALNKGIKRCKTDYYLVVGADDRLNADAIENYQRVLSRKETDLVSAYVKVGNKTIKPKKGMSWIYGAWSFVTSHAVGTLIKKDLHEQYGLYDVNYPICADADFILKAIRNRASLQVVPFIAGEYALGGLSNVNIAWSIFDFFLVQSKFYPKTIQLMLLYYRLAKTYAKY
ncbi:glycosyltransferase [Thermosynechococcus sichuanensis E542]|uniref:Glycosyltransferase n=1 Tax=Thermosynechococcus sichuanensis E542 TaxID=2016101 RepID=A0A3B7MLT9_9CYAN|nr:glycosyltransferase family 2 protein [Thermosynechococcus vestitus]AXY68086.1 glycosyltransferase [Thermosynechococcus vestitus E542]